MVSNRAYLPGDGLLEPLLEHESAFRAFLRRRLNDEAVVEDVLQQSLLRAVEHEHTLHNSDSIVSWFYRILRNAVIDYYRARAAETRKRDGFVKESSMISDQAVPSPDEMRPTICACLDRVLPTIRPAYADLLRRVDLHGASLDAVAHDLKVTKNNLTVRLHRARQALRSALEASCGICAKHGCLHCTCE